MKDFSVLTEPLDIARLSLDDQIFVKCRGSRELKGRLHAYDMHLNLVLADVEETCVATLPADDIGQERSKKVMRRMPLIFVRGDAIVCITPIES